MNIRNRQGTPSPRRRPGTLLGLGLLMLAAACAGSKSRGPQSLGPQWLVVDTLPLVLQESSHDCGFAALAMVLGHLDSSWTMAQVQATFAEGLAPGERAQVFTESKDGLRAGRMRQLVRRAGHRAYLIRADRNDLLWELEQGRPVLVGLYKVRGRKAFPHYAVVAGVRRDGQRVLLADPDGGWQELAWDRFSALWQAADHLALVIIPAKGTHTVAVTDR